MKKYLITGGAFVLLTVFRYPINILWVKLLTITANSAQQLPEEISLFSVVFSKIVIDLFVFGALAVYNGSKAKEKFLNKYPYFGGMEKYKDEYWYNNAKNASIFSGALPFILAGITVCIIDGTTINSIYQLINK